MNQRYDFARNPWKTIFMAADGGGGSGGGKTLKDQLEEATQAKASAEQAKASAEQARDAAIQEKLQAEQAKATAEQAKATAEQAKVTAETEAKTAKDNEVKAREFAARHGTVIPAKLDGAAADAGGKKDFGNLTGLERAIAAHKATPAK